MKTIHTEHAPKAIGAYSQAILADKTLYMSGQIGMDPKTTELISADFAEQLTQVFHNMQAVLKETGGDFSNIVKLTVYLVDSFEHFPKLNEIMQQFFKAPFPARTTIAVAALPKNALVEIDAIAVL